jgi:hypothetical protein
MVAVLRDGRHDGTRQTGPTASREPFLRTG